MKICTKCKRELPLDKFPLDKKYKDGHSWHCKECRSAYYKTNYICGKRTVDSYKTHCAKCHCADTYVLTFHHINPKNKSFDISIARRGNNAVREEIKKCICLCYNCHHTYHYFYGMRPTNPEETLEEYLSPDWIPPVKV